MFGSMPQFTGNSNTDITSLYDYVVALRRELDDLLYNLDDDNMRTITAKSIETSTLVVGDNIAMGPNAVISWGQVEDGPNVTRIDANGIYTGTIEAEQINTVGLSAERIYQAGYPNNYAYIGGVGSGLILKKDGDTYFVIDKDSNGTNLYGDDGSNFLTSTGSVTKPQGLWNFNEVDDITGFYWDDISVNPFIDYLPSDFATSGHAHGSTYIKNYTPSDNISISATDFGLIIRDGSTILGQIDYDIIGG
jgi:hypothetical protein